MRKSTNCSKLIKQMLGIAVTISGGILVAQLISKKIHNSKETYQISVNFEDDYS